LRQLESNYVLFFFFAFFSSQSSGVSLGALHGGSAFAEQVNQGKPPTTTTTSTAELLLHKIEAPNTSILPTSPLNCG
jgi:hypothetical protein